MPYTLVIFDVGGVALEVASDRLIQHLSQLLGRAFDDVQRVIYHEELLLPFELGRIGPTAYYAGLKERLALPWTYEQFVRAWNDIFLENTEVTRIMQRLRRRHRLIALTNTNALHLGHIRGAFPSLAVLEDWVASCEAGLRKPDPAFYRLALERSGVRASQAVYVDDRPELVDAGRGVGLTAIRFERGQQLEQDLQALGLEL